MRRYLSAVCFSIFVGLLPVFFFAITSLAQQAPTLSVAGSDVYLYTSQEESSNVITKLEAQQTLIPLATIPGPPESWYLVKTQKGISGWVKSSGVLGTDKMENSFKETPLEPDTLSLPPIPESFPLPLLERDVTVSVEMEGSMIIVPVLINRSLKTFMVMDTGASLTMISPRVAKELGLPSISRVSVTTANGTMNVPLTRLGSLKVGEAEVHGLLATVQSFSPDPRVEGLLGLNFLSRFHTSLDLSRQLLSLAPR